MIIIERIDQICDSFELAWHGSSAPEISEYLSQIDSAFRPDLLLKLVQVDVECRRRRSLLVMASDYERFGEPAIAAAAAWVSKLDSEPPVEGSPLPETVIRSSEQCGTSEIIGPTSGVSADNHQVPSIIKTIGPYRIVKRIGKGGMGEVYLAEQNHPYRQVALKVIKSELRNDSAVLKFRMERQALALMDHPNIARVLDAGMTEEGQPFVVMELVNGQSIVRYCDEHKLSLKERLNLFSMACRAIQHAHNKGIIHRDVTANNVLVTEYDGVAALKVIDFGLVAIMPDSENSRLFNLSYDGVPESIAGTISYMSPEQALDASKVDSRTDIYSLGALLYELLIGDTPIAQKRMHGMSFESKLRAVQEDVPAPSLRLASLYSDAAAVAQKRRITIRQLNRELVNDLDWITLKALSTKREDRYVSALQFLEDIDRFIGGMPVFARPRSAGYLIGKLIRRAWPK